MYLFSYIFIFSPVLLYYHKDAKLIIHLSAITFALIFSYALSTDNYRQFAETRLFMPSACSRLLHALHRNSVMSRGPGQHSASYDWLRQS